MHSTKALTGKSSKPGLLMAGRCCLIEVPLDEVDKPVQTLYFKKLQKKMHWSGCQARGSRIWPPVALHHSNGPGSAMDIKRMSVKWEESFRRLWFSSCYSQSAFNLTAGMTAWYPDPSWEFGGKKKKWKLLYGQIGWNLKLWNRLTCTVDINLKILPLII